MSWLSQCQGSQADEIDESRQHQLSSFHKPSVGAVTSVFGSFLVTRTEREPIPPLHQNVGDQAVCLFLHQYVIYAQAGGNPGYLDFIPELYQNSKPDDALAHSIRAISYVSLSSQSSVKVLAARGHEHYRTTLSRVTRMLESPEEIVQDSLIVAILLLVLFENMTREKPAVMMNHARGLHSVLLHRGEGQLHDTRGFAIFRQVLAHTQVRNIEMSQQPSPETIPWLQEIDKSTPGAGSLWEKYLISQVRATAAEKLSLPSGSVEVEQQLQVVLQEAQAVDTEVASWAEHLPDVCMPQVWRLTSTGVADKTPGIPSALQGHNDAGFIEPPIQHVLTYTDVWFCALWHGHRTSRLMLNETIIRLARRLNLPAAVQDAAETIQQMVRETCASAAFSLGDVYVRVDELGRDFLQLNIDSSIKRGGGAGANFVIWSLRHVVSCEFATDAQIQEASSALLRIGAQFGFKQAFTLANRQHLCHPSLQLT